MSFTFNEIFGSIAIVVSCGAAVLLVKLLLSNTMQQEKFFNSLGKCYTQLEDASNKLETLCTILDRRFSNMEDNKRQSDPLLINTLQRFDKVSQEIRDRLDDLLETDFSVTNTTTSAEATAQAVVQEINKLQSNLDELSGQLRRNNYLAMDENAEIAAMRKRIESYQSMVMKARSEAKESESLMAALRNEIEKLRVSGPAIDNTLNIAQDTELQTQVSSLEQEKKALEAQIAALNDEMQRNNIEKKFIEERFIELS